MIWFFVFLLTLYYAYPLIRYRAAERRILNRCKPFTACYIDELDMKEVYYGLPEDTGVLEYATTKPTEEGLQKLKEGGKRVQICYRLNIPGYKDLFKEHYFES